MADYPNSTTDPRVVENKPGREYQPELTTRVFAEDINGLADEVVAIETELGTNPKGSAESVKDRIENIEESLTWYDKKILKPQDGVFPASGGASLGQYDGSAFQAKTIEFPDSAETKASFLLPIPVNYNGNEISIALFYLLDADTDGVIRHSLNCRTIDDNVALDGTANAIFALTNDQVGGGSYAQYKTFIMYKTWETNLPDAGSAQLIYYRRAGQNVADTLVGNLRLLEIRFFIPVSL